MNDIDITLFLNEYRVKALEEALGNRTAETIEDICNTVLESCSLSDTALSRITSRRQNGTRKQ